MGESLIRKRAISQGLKDLNHSVQGEAVAPIIPPQKCHVSGLG